MDMKDERKVFRDEVWDGLSVLINLLILLRCCFYLEPLKISVAQGQARLKEAVFIKKHTELLVVSSSWKLMLHIFFKSNYGCITNLFLLSSCIFQKLLCLLFNRKCICLLSVSFSLRLLVFSLVADNYSRCANPFQCGP